MSHRSPPSVFEVWSETSSRMLTSAIKVNRAAMTAFGILADGAGNADDADPNPEDCLDPGEDLPE